MPINSVIWQEFSKSLPHIPHIFIILQHVVKITDWEISLLLFWQWHSLLLKLCKKQLLILVRCLAWHICWTVSLLKYPISFLHKCILCEGAFSLTWNCISLFQFHSTSNTIQMYLIFSKWVQRKNSHYYWRMKVLELTLTVLCVILPELVPATLDSLSSSNLVF